MCRIWKMSKELGTHAEEQPEATSEDYFNEEPVTQDFYIFTLPEHLPAMLITNL